MHPQRIGAYSEIVGALCLRVLLHERPLLVELHILVRIIEAIAPAKERVPSMHRLLPRVRAATVPVVGYLAHDALPTHRALRTGVIVRRKGTS